MTDNWDKYFMDIALRTALRSKDPNTKVGACIVKDKHILSVGYNGAPKGFPDDDVPKESTSNILAENKNSYMCHAELNSVLNYKGSLLDLNGATIYVTHSPCHACSSVLAQVGISEVVYSTRFHREDSAKLSDYILSKCKIKTRKLEVE